MSRITAGVEFHHPPKLPIVYLLPAKIAICKICVGQGGVGHKRPTPRGPIRPGAALAGLGRRSALAAALRRTRRGPNGRPARKGGEIAAPRSSSGGNAPANMPPAPFPHPPLPGGGFLSAAQSPPPPAPPSCAGAAPIAALSFPGGLCRPKRNRTLSRRWREKRPAFLVSVCCGAPQPPAAIKPGPWPPGSPWYP